MKRLAGILVACLLVATCASCKSIQFIGDSITAQSQADLHAHYDGKYGTSVIEYVGADAWFFKDLVAQQAAKPPNIEVINLRTNDANRTVTPNPPEPVQAIDDILGRLDTFRASSPRRPA